MGDDNVRESGAKESGVKGIAAQDSGEKRWTGRMGE
jgi:hypothetical protein